jgi:DNA-binding transcriptional LysR family regulator
MVEISQMKTLVLVSSLGSLAAAARELKISPAAVSKQISRLEEEVGLQLILRSTRKLEFTEVGENYCAQCQRVLEEVDAASDLVSNMKVIPHGILKVFSGRHFANSYIVPHLKEFLSLYPQIEMTLELGERMPDINAESIDVLIGMSISATGDMIQKRILTTSYSFCASPDYLKNFGTPKKPKDLLEHRYITHAMRKPDNELIFDNKDVVTLKPYLRLNDTEAMLKLAQEGLGIVKLHDYVVRELISRGELVELLSSYTKMEIPLYTAFPQRRFIPAKVRVFIDFINSKISRNG